MRTLLGIFITAMLAFVSTGCMTSVGNAVVHDVSRVCRPGMSRAEVIAVLGRPRQSQHFVPAVAYSTFADAPRWVKPQTQVSAYDEYRVSGLTLVHSPYVGNHYDREAWAAGLTLGVSEVVYSVPAAAVDLSARPFERHPIRLWYDHSERVIAADDGPEKPPAHKAR